MMFSKSCEYAIKAAIHIHIQSLEGRRTGIAEIAKAIDSPLAFTGKILQLLSRHRIVSSVKGPGGGFFIDADAAPIAVMDIVKLVDGPAAFERCGLGLKECDATHPCPIHNEFVSYSARLKNLLEQKSVQQMAKEIAAGKAHLMNY